MPRRPSSTQIIAFSLFLLACVLGVLSQNRTAQPVLVTRARYADASPLGGKGLRLLLERLDYRTRVEGGVLRSMPRDAKVWVLLDPYTGFSGRESKLLLDWVENGGTLVWAATPKFVSMMGGALSAWDNEGLRQLRRELKLNDSDSMPTAAFNQSTEPLPPLTPLKLSAASEAWSGVKKAQGSGGGFELNRPHLELAASPIDVQFAQVPYGKGRVFIVPDALMFTNYALSKPDNAVLVSNLVRLHAPSGSLVVFDERQHGAAEEKVEPNWVYYLWRPPLRYAVIQLLVAAVLAAILYGRRLGTPVPLPDSGPVTRASQWAAAMGSLFQKVGRPRVAGTIIGEDFRRQLTRRLGLSIEDPDDLIAKRAAEATGYSERVIDRLLLQAKVPDDDEARVLSDAQEMETILRSLDQR